MELLANPVTGSSGAGAAALLGVCHAANARGIGPLPLPTTLPSMATLEALTGNLEKLGGKLFRGLEETNLAVYDKVLQGFKDTSSKCKNFIHEMGSLVVTFFTQAEEMEKGLAKCDAMAFREAMSASKGHVCGLIEQVAKAEGIFDAGEANFDSVLVSVAKEVKAYVQLRGDEQRKEYKKECLDQIRWDHGQLDGMCLIPMIVGNLTAHQALAMSQRVVHSHVPLKIMMAPLHTQAGAVKVYMKFVEFLARRVIALQERLGPGLPWYRWNQNLVVDRLHPGVNTPAQPRPLASLHLHPGMALLSEQTPARRHLKTPSARIPKVLSSCGPP